MNISKWKLMIDEYQKERANSMAESVADAFDHFIDDSGYVTYEYNETENGNEQEESFSNYI